MSSLHAALHGGHSSLTATQPSELVIVLIYKCQYQQIPSDEHSLEISRLSPFTLAIAATSVVLQQYQHIQGEH